jgi:hypothetical protein
MAKGVAFQVLHEGGVLVPKVGEERAMARTECLYAQRHALGSRRFLPAHLRRASFLALFGVRMRDVFEEVGHGGRVTK